MEIINAFPMLRVDELQIRLSQPSDTTKIVNYYKSNRKYLEPWEPNKSESFFTFDSWQKRLFQLEKLQQHGLAFYFLIFSNHVANEILGIVSYNSVSQYPFYSATLGYSLAKSAQSKGVMSRALSATNQWMFEHLSLHRICASYMPRNQRSAAVLESLGFVIEGKAKKYLLINGQWEDHVLTSLINNNWQATQVGLDNLNTK